MRTNRPLLQHIAMASPLIFAPLASADIDTLEAWGNAAGTTPAPGLVAGGGTYALTGGGADFWGNSDQGVFAWDSTGAMTTTGDFTATVRVVSVDDPAPQWGRDTLSVRATQAPGAVAADDAHFMAVRKSNGDLQTGSRLTPTTGTNQRGAPLWNGGGPNTTPWLAVSREGNTLRSGMARDLGGAGIQGRWVQNDTRTIAAFDGGNEVVVGLGHQSHPQSGGGGADGVNTGTFDSLTFQNSYDATPFGAPAGPGTWQVDGAVGVVGSGVITASAFVREGGVATGEPTEWTVTATQTGVGAPFVPQFGTSNVRDNTPKNDNDLVPAANFRFDSGSAPGSGLNADIYMATNNGNNLTANRNTIDTNAATASVTIPSVNWTNDGANAGYFNGTSASFADAVNPGADPGITNFTGNEENYGVHITGQIFIPADVDRVNNAAHGGEWITFQDGIDDFTYLEIDGVALLNDNNWTSPDGVGNNGSNVGLMDVSDPKFDDGEWVDFEMITWEGGGGDAGKLFWSALDTDGDMDGAPTPQVLASFSASGTDQLGNESSQEQLFAGLPEGEYIVTMTNNNTGTSITIGENLVVPEPSSSLLLALASLGLVARRRRS